MATQILRVGRYTLEKQLGSGGMAVTYRGHLDGLAGFRKDVVIKLLRADLLESEQQVAMFLDEARLSAHFQHPNIAQVFEVDQENQQPYIVMEYIDGPLLSLLFKHTREQRPDPRRFAWIMARICKALAHVHGLQDASGQPLNVIHRDVSLSNIILTQSGVPKLLDLSLIHI